MSVGTAFHPRTAPLNRKMQWREWSGYFASSTYADFHDIEYNAIREAAALIDVSPLYKYRVAGPDATRLVDRVITRDATRLAPGQVYYTPWCDEYGKVIDDGTVHHLDDGSYRWTAADPQSRWLHLNAAGLDVAIVDETEAVAGLALQGPFSRDVLEAAAETSFADLRYFRRRTATIVGVGVDVSRTGYTGDLGYELWIPWDAGVQVWDAIFEAGQAFGIHPAGIRALDVCRVEAGLILAEVEFSSARHVTSPELKYSPFEVGLGRLVELNKASDFVGKRALQAEQRAGGPARRLVGLELEWSFEPDLPPIEPDAEVAVFRIAQESLTNIARHAQAKRIWLSVGRGRDSIVLRVIDDGRGMNGAPAAAGGLRGMRERAVIIGAALSIKRAATGGVEVRLEVPAAREAALAARP